MADPPTSTTLLDLLSNSVVFDTLISHLSLQTITRLSRTSKAHHHFVFNTPKVFRCLDLSRCKGAYIPNLTPIDSGGHSWRAERIDENLTEDEFYSGPLRGVLSKLRSRRVLRDVQTLILDELASVTHDLVAELVTSDEYNIKILSIRKCVNVNQSLLQQLLSYICRPSRPEGTPRLKGLYIFTEPEPLPRETTSGFCSTESASGITSSDGATLGVLPTSKLAQSSCNASISSPYYESSGLVVKAGHKTRTSWEETLLTCHGIISFDAIHCTAMHSHLDQHDAWHEGSRDFLSSSSKPGIPPLATVALGSDGCSGCGRAPEDTPVWGESDLSQFPLLWPPAWSGRVEDCVRPPTVELVQSSHHPYIATSSNHASRMTQSQRLIVSCSWCLANRHCDSCHRWWCADCYNPRGQTKKLKDLEVLNNAGLNYVPSRAELSVPSSEGHSGSGSVKVFNGFCVENCLVGEWMIGAGGMGMWG